MPPRNFLINLIRSYDTEPCPPQRNLQVACQSLISSLLCYWAALWSHFLEILIFVNSYSWVMGWGDYDLRNANQSPSGGFKIEKKNSGSFSLR